MRPFSAVFLAFLLGLAACAPAAKQYSYTPPANPGGRMCTLQCSEARNYCNQNCEMDQRLCTNQVQTKALRDYEQYTRDQFIAHEPIELHARDFERMEPCTDAKKSCVADCESTYQSCYESCGGKVDTSSSCQFFCF